jgi:hypothetical protein
MWSGRLRNLDSRLADTWLCYHLTKGKRISREWHAQESILRTYINTIPSNYSKILPFRYDN